MFKTATNARPYTGNGSFDYEVNDFTNQNNINNHRASQVAQLDKKFLGSAALSVLTFGGKSTVVGLMAASALIGFAGGGLKVAYHNLDAINAYKTAAAPAQDSALGKN